MRADVAASPHCVGSVVPDPRARFRQLGGFEYERADRPSVRKIALFPSSGTRGAARRPRFHSRWLPFLPSRSSSVRFAVRRFREAGEALGPTGPLTKPTTFAFTSGKPAASAWRRLRQPPSPSIRRGSSQGCTGASLWLRLEVLRPEGLVLPATSRTCPVSPSRTNGFVLWITWITGITWIDDQGGDFADAPPFQRRPRASSECVRLRRERAGAASTGRTLAGACGGRGRRIKGRPLEFKDARARRPASASRGGFSTQ